MNKVILMGRLTRDPEIRYSQGEGSMAIARFSLAVDRRFKRDGEATADFFNCTAFGKQADFVEKYLKQGSKILVTGRIENNNYTDKNGNKVYSVQIMIEELEFAESKAASGQSNQSREVSEGPVRTGADGFMSIPAGFEELPFN